MSSAQQEFYARRKEAGAEEPAASSPDHVVASRKGDVLFKYTILKSDHFPGCQNKKLLPLIEGVPNFRQVPGLPVFGVAIPTVSGLQRVLQRLGAEQGQRKVLWHNMREEPVLYINGKPYVVREANKPFANLEYTGINKGHVEAMENRLKQDVLKEALQYGNQIMVAHEDDDFQIVQKWEAVTEVDVQTPAEVYRELEEDGYDVDYQRVPVTDEKAPKERDFVFLVRRLWQQPRGTALVFNCQMGRGRTSTGMIIASLLLLRQASNPLTLCPEPQEGLPSWFVGREVAPGESPRPQSLEAELKAGMYGVIRSLLRVLEGGAASKAVLDSVIDAASAMQNLREAIAGYRSRLMHENNEDKRNALLHVCLEYLERYFVLIAFAAYIMDPAFDPLNPKQPTFGVWMKDRSELRSVLQRLLRRNPLAALSLHRPARSDRTAQLDEEPKMSGSGALLEEDPIAHEAAEDETASLVANRNGEVLGPHAIVKEDHFPGVQSSKLHMQIQGAPNFRGVAGHNVFGTAMPTVEGMRRVLAHVGAAPEATNSYGHEVKAHWYNMREEVLVYVNGRPLVLREDERPFKNMQEYTGIDVQRLEQMEARLKADIVREAGAHQGKLLVAREVMGCDEGASASIVDNFVPITGPEDVQTPREVYEALSKEGYRVVYHRVPLTDGSAPREPVFDMFYHGIRQASQDDPVIFNCQMGAGRTTTGMVIACLVRVFEFGRGRVSQAEVEAANEQEGEIVDGGSPRSTASEDVGGLSPSSSGTLDDLKPALAIAHSRANSLVNLEEDALETLALKDGEYVGVRRFTRILERGNEAKVLTDTLVDMCGALVNLRTAIMRYRRPQGSSRFYRPEINVRHTAFQRGSAYLERYCMLITFEAFLEANRRHSSTLTFQEWMSARPDILAARDALHQNPAGALAPVPPAHIPHLWLSAERHNSREVEVDEQKQVLSKRRGSTLSRRSILKSYKPAHAPRHNALHLEGVADIRKAKSLPVYAVGSCTVQGMRNLMSTFGARPGGNSHVVITDLREELVVYVNGRPYLRRELEMPAAALHHAGIHAVKLEELERRLRNDMMHEAMTWGGRVLLHREVSLPKALPSSSNEVEGGDDVTRKEDVQLDACVAAFWEHTGDMGDIDVGLATPLEVYQSLAAEGYQMSHRRVPLSRERTPEAADLDVLHQQLLVQPEGKNVVHLIVSRTATGSSARFVGSFAAAFIGMSRAKVTIAGTMSTTYGANPNAGAYAPGMSSALSSSLTNIAGAMRSSSPAMNRSLGRTQALLEQSGYDAPDSPGRTADGGMGLFRSTSIIQGEYRGIMNLLRVLPDGPDAKLVVDTAIDLCTPIGNLRNDIVRGDVAEGVNMNEDQILAWLCRCKEAAEMGAEQQTGSSGMRSPFERASEQSSAASARRLGLHYLQRYFYLITFFCYLDSGSASTLSFGRWMAERRELKHMLSTLSLEPVN